MTCVGGGYGGRRQHRKIRHDSHWYFFVLIAVREQDEPGTVCKWFECSVTYNTHAVRTIIGIWWPYNVGEIGYMEGNG